MLSRATTFLMLAAAFLLSVETISVVDVWWHVKTGELALAGVFPVVRDPFSYTHAGTPWTNVPWLHQVVSAFVLRLGGPDLLVWTKATICLLAVASTLATAATIRRLSANVRWRGEVAELPDRGGEATPAWAWTFAAVAYFFLALAPAQQRFLQRPEIWTFLCGGWLLFCLVRARLSSHRWLLGAVLVQLLWCNTHGAFAIGWGVAGAFAGGELLMALLRARRGQPWQRDGRPFYLRGWCLGALSIVAVCLANPRGWEGMTYPLFLLRVLAGSSHRVMQTWIAEAAPAFQTPLEPEIWAYFAACVVTLTAIAAFDRLGDPGGRRARDVVRTFGLGHLLLLPVMIYLAQSARRNVPLFFFFMAPIGLVCLDGLARAAWSRLSPSRRGRVVALDAVGALVLAALVYGLIARDALPGREFERGPGLGASPLLALEGPLRFIQANEIRGPWFANIAAANYFLYRLGPEQRVFIDGRIAEIYCREDTRFFENYIETLHARRAFQRTAAQYGFNAILVGFNEEGVETLVRTLRSLPEWVPVYLDPSGAVFVRDRPENRRLIDRHALSRADAPSDRILSPPLLLDGNPLSARILDVLCLGCERRGENEEVATGEVRALLLMGYPLEANAAAERLVAAGVENSAIWGMMGQARMSLLPAWVFDPPLEDDAWPELDPAVLDATAEPFERALSERSSDATALPGVGLLHLLRGEPVRSYELLTGLLANLPWLDPVRLRAAIAAEQAGNRSATEAERIVWWRRAAEHYEELLVRGRLGGRADLRLALLYARLGEAERARRLALAVLRRGASDEAEERLRRRIGGLPPAGDARTAPADDDQRGEAR